MDVVFSVKVFSNQIAQAIREDLARILISGLLVVWLLLLLLPFSAPPGDAGAFYAYFLPCFVVTLLALGAWGSGEFLNLTLASALGCVALTFGLLLAVGVWRDALLLLLGLVAAPLAIRLGILLKEAAHPLPATFLGLGLGAGLSLAAPADGGGLGLTHQTLTMLGALTLACLLLFGLRRVRPRVATLRGQEVRRLCLAISLPFVLAFQFFVGMLSMASLTPDGLGGMAAWNVVFYLAGCLIASRLVGDGRSVTFLSAVALVAFGLLLREMAPALLGSKWCLLLCMTASGMVLWSLLVLILAQNHPIRAFGYGFGVFFAGLLAGHWFALSVGEVDASLLLFGLLMLNLAQVWQQRTLAPSDGVAAPPATTMLEPAAVALVEPRSSALPASLTRDLSRQEGDVLALIHRGLAYREIAVCLAISESSVKTYAQRIFRKLGIHRRRRMGRAAAQPVEIRAQSERLATGDARRGRRRAAASQERRPRDWVAVSWSGTGGEPTAQRKTPRCRGGILIKR